jgi:hypothetical protein
MSARAEHTPLLPGMEPARTPIARATDPKTSHQAAEAVTASGKRDEQIQQVLELVKAHPGSTSLELAQHTKILDRYAIARRLPELEGEKKVYKGVPKEAVIDGKKQKNAVTWFPGKPTEHTGTLISDLEQLVEKTEAK